MSEPGFEVAAAFVRVTPDTSDFPSALDEQLGGLALSVVLTPNTSDFASMLDDALGGLTISAVVTPDASNFAAALDDQIGGLTVTAVVTPDASNFAAAFGEQAGNLTASVSLSPEAAGAANLGDAINEQAGTIALPVVPVPEVSGFEEMLTDRIGDLSVPVQVYPDAADFQERLDEQVGTPVVGVDVQASVANMAEHLADSLTGSIPVPVVPDAGMFTDKLDEELAGLTVSVGVVPSASSLDSFQSLIEEGAGDLQVTATVVLNDDGALEYLAQLSAAEDAVASSADMSGAVSSITELGAAEEGAASGAAGLQGQVTAAAEAVAELAGAGDSAAASGAALQGSMAVSADAVSSWRVDLVALSGQYSDLQGQFSAMEGELDSLNARFGTLSGGQAGATEASAAMSAQLMDVNTQFAAVAGEIDSFAPRLSTMVGAAAGADEQLGLLSSMVSELQGSLSSAGDAVGGWSASITEAAPPATEAASGFSKVLGELSGRLSYMLVDPFMWMYAAPVVISGVSVAVKALAGDSMGLVNELSALDDAAGYNAAGYQKMSSQISVTAQNLSSSTKSFDDNYASVSRFGQSMTGASGTVSELNAAAAAAADKADNLDAHLGTLEGTYGLTAQQAEQLAGAAGVSATELAGSGKAASDAMTQVEAYANANINATGPVNQMATEMSIFGDDALTASTRVTALDGAYGTLVGSFVSTQQNALQVASDFLAISANAQQAGASMTGTNAQSVVLQQSFFTTAGAIEQTANAMVKQGDTTQQVTGYIGEQITKLQGLTGGSAQAQQAVQGLKQWEDNLTESTGNVYGAINQAADALASKFSKNLTQAGLTGTPRTSKTDVDNLTTFDPEQRLRGHLNAERQGAADQGPRGRRGERHHRQDRRRQLHHLHREDPEAGGAPDHRAGDRHDLHYRDRAASLGRAQQSMAGQHAVPGGPCRRRTGDGGFQAPPGRRHPRAAVARRVRGERRGGRQVRHRVPRQRERAALRGRRLRG